MSNDLIKSLIRNNEARYSKTVFVNPGFTDSDFVFLKWSRYILLNLKSLLKKLWNFLKQEEFRLKSWFENGLMK